MENAAVKDFFILLRSALWGASCKEMEENPDWKDIMRLAQSHTVSGLICSTVLNHSGELSLSEKKLMQMKMQVFSTVALNEKMNAVLLRVAGQLNASDIRFALLKGQGLASCYPEPELRQCGDIDIMVRESDFDRTSQVLSKLEGYQKELCDIDKHKTIVISGIDIEIHKTSMKFPGSGQNRRYRNIEEKNWLSRRFPDVQIEGKPVPIFPAELNAFFVFAHIFSHFFISGIGLRQFCDWAMFLHRNRDILQRAELKTILEDMGMMLPWQIFGCILVGHLGLPAEEFPFYDASCTARSGRVLKIVLAGGNFGYDFNQGGRPTGYVASKLYSVVHYFKVFFKIQSIMPIIALKYLMHSLSNGFHLFYKDLKKS